MNKTRNEKRPFYFSKPLFHELDKIFDYPLTILEAPVGYGKTTAARNYLVSTECFFLWQTLHSSVCQDFWEALALSFQKVDKACGEKLLFLKFPSNVIARHQMLDIFNEAALDRPLVIVVDDFHLIDTQEMASFLWFLAVNEVLNLHILLIGRSIRRLRCGELMIKGLLHHIYKESLELSSIEIRKYYGLYCLRIKQEDAAKLFELTEGWISALYILMLNYRKTGSLFVFSGLDRLIEQIIYRPLPQETKDFLLKMSLFCNFTESMAIYLLNCSRETLKEMIQNSSFVWYDRVAEAYHIHNLLAVFLEKVRKSFPKAFFEHIYCQAAHWYLQEKEYLRALQYFYLGGDFENLYRTLEQEGGQTIKDQDKKMLIGYYLDCPNEIRARYPFAVLVIARYLHTFQEIDLFHTIYQELEMMTQTYQVSNPSVYHNLLGELEALQALLCFNDVALMGVHIKNASQLMNRPSKVFSRSQSYTFGAPSVLYLYYRASGELSKTIDDMFYYQPFYHRISQGHGRGACDLIQAEWLYYKGEYENSEIYLYRTYQMKPSKESGILLCSLILNMKLCFMKGEMEQILQLLKRAREIYQGNEDVFNQTIDLYEAYFYASIGVFGRVKTWIISGDQQDCVLYYPALSYLNLIYGKILLEKRQYLKLIGMSAHILEMVCFFPNILGRITIYIYMAAAYLKLSRETEAEYYLEQALELAIPDDMYMPFVENCHLIEPLLVKKYRNSGFLTAVKQIFHLSKQFRRAKDQLMYATTLSPSKGLTGREYQVARLAAQGWSNKEIGAQLFISENTVKTQLKKIYSKLNINSRLLLKETMGYDN